MVRRDDAVLPHAVDNQVLVDRQGECLANVDIIEWFHQVIHGVEVDPQLGNLLILVIGKHLCLGYIGGRNTSKINLTCLIRLVYCVYALVERINELCQLWFGSIVVGVWHEDDLLVVGILTDFPWASAATFGQVIGEVSSILVNQALFHHVGAGITQGIQEVGNSLVSDDHNGAVIRCEQAITNDGFDFARLPACQSP